MRRASAPDGTSETRCPKSSSIAPTFCSTSGSSSTTRTERARPRMAGDVFPIKVETRLGLPLQRATKSQPWCRRPLCYGGLAAHLIAPLDRGSSRDRAQFPSNAFGGEEWLHGLGDGSGVHPSPVSVTERQTYRRAASSPLTSDSSAASRPEIVIVPPSGIASRAFTARFNSASSSWFASISARARPKGSASRFES